MCLTKEETARFMEVARQMKARGLDLVVDGTWTVECFKFKNREYLKNENIRIRNGCTKMVVLFDGIDYVMKLNIAQGKMDFCLREYELYQKAIKAGLERFFAGVEIVGVVDGMNVYAQEIANPDEDYIISLREEYARSVLPADVDEEQISEYAQFDMDIEEQIESIFGDVEGLCDLTDFVLYNIEDEQLEIGADLHSGNFGITRDDRVVLFDYSGFGW